MKTVIDNDIIFKGVCYGILEKLLLTISNNLNSIGVLEAARYVILKKINKTYLKKSKKEVFDKFNEFLAKTMIIEPTKEEISMAADLEFLAQQAGVAFDCGESMLCSIVVFRSLSALITGDKRAIKAMEVLLDSEPRLESLCGKVICLEQLVLYLYLAEKGDEIKTTVCNESHIDKTLSICFSCESKNSPTHNSIIEGLKSYINDLRTSAYHILMK